MSLRTSPPTETVSATAETRPALDRRWTVVALVVGYFALVAWRIWLVRDIITPAAHADEDGYLLAARALAGGAGGYSTENVLFRRVGYPMLLAPIYWFTSNPFTVYQAVQVLNALINALVLPLAYLAARRVFRLPRPLAVGAAVAVVTMPAVAFYSEFAMADAVLAPLGVTWLLFLHGWLVSTGRRRLGSAVAAGVVAGVIGCAHIRGLMVLVAHFVIMGMFLIMRKVTGRQVLAGSAAAIALAMVDPLLKYSLHDKIVVTGSSPGGKAIDAVTTVHGIALTTVRMIGQVWYLGMGTWGLGAIALVGLALAARPTLRTVRVGTLTGGLRHPGRVVAALRAANPAPATLIMVGVLFTTALVALGSSMSLPTWDHRIGYFAYPRYIHFLFPLWVLAGTAALRSVTAQRAKLLIGGGFLLTGLTGVVTRQAVASSEAYRFMPFDSPELSLLSWNWTELKITVPTVLGLVILLVVGAAMAAPLRKLAGVAFAAIIAVNLAASAINVQKITHPMVDFQYPASTPQLVRDAHLHPGDVVAESVAGPWYLQYNHMREVYWMRLMLFDNRVEAAPAEANVVVAPYQTGKADKTGKLDWQPPAGWVRVAEDKVQHWAVWRRN